jgi:outer membrane protein
MNKLVLLLALFGSSLGWSQTEVWTLQRCFEQGMKNSLEAKIKSLQVKKAQKLHQPLVLTWLPEVSLGGTQSYNFGSTIDPATNGRVSSNIQNDNFYLNAQMNLINFEVWAYRSRSGIDPKIAQADLAVFENEYQWQILESYGQALLAQSLQNIQQEQLKNAAFNLDRVTQEVALGSKPTSDLYDMQLSHGQEKIRCTETQQLAALRKRELLQLINAVEVAPDQITLEQPQNISALDVQTKSFSNPKIALAELNWQASQAEKRRLRARNLPVLSTYYSASTFYYKPLNQPSVVVDDFQTQFKNNKNQQVGLQLYVPVFNGFRNNRNVSAARIEEQKSKCALDLAKRQVENQLQTETQKKSHYQILSEQYEQVVQWAESSFKTSQAKFSAGKIDAVVFSSVKNQWLNAQFDQLKNQLMIQLTDFKIKLIQGQML